MECDPAVLGRQLREALDDRGWTIKDFQQNLPSVRGTSYGSVWAYVKGQGSENPKGGLIESMAETLGVRLEWLAYDQGGKTEEDERLRAMAEKIAVGKDVLKGLADAQEDQDEFEEEIRRALQEAFGAPISYVALAVFVRAWSSINADPYTTERLTAERFASALAAGLDQLAGLIGQPDSDVVESYIIEAAPTLARTALQVWGETLQKKRVGR